VGAINHYSRLRAIACALGALACASSPPAIAGKSTASAGVITLRKLSILNLSDLNFATNVAGAAAGTVTIDPENDTRANTGGTIAAGGVPQAAKFYTFGGPLQNLQVTRGALPVLSRVGGGATMNVTGLTLNGPVLRFLNAAGLLDLRVGGTLAVGANQLPGAYAGTFQIIVTYY
jgi:spore coat protein U-like protein